MQDLRELASDRAIVGRIGCGVAGTVAVLVGSPPAWVLALASCVLLLVATAECTAARRRMTVPARSTPAAGGSYLHGPAVDHRS